jgi:hypothetical protein
MLGHTRDWVARRVNLGVLEGRDIAGEKKVSRRSVERVLAQQGMPSEDEQELERLEESGQYNAAIPILQRMQARANEAERALLGGHTVSQVLRGGGDPETAPVEETPLIRNLRKISTGGSIR